MVHQTLKGKDGIIGVTVDGHGNAQIEYDNTIVGPRDIIEAVKVRF